jgi:tRNA-Thr(GGU) m(6)t(6)A37 methyltransferase TsaA
MTLGWISLMSSGYAETKKTGERESRSGKIDSLYMNPIGVVKRQGDRAFLEVNPGLAPALDGLVDFSHVWVLYWFHEHDNPADRAILKVHPRRDPANPLTGVFANRAPVRPNLIGFTACRIVKVEGSRVEVADLDARDGSPILDLKPYIPKGDAIPDARTPEWVKRISKSGD